MLNRYMLELFGEVSRMEEMAVAGGGFRNLTVTELHVVHTVCEMEACAERCTSARVAKKLHMKPEYAAAMVLKLEQKGYLTRRRGEKQQAYLASTALGKKAYQCHLDFHRQMSDQVLDTMTEEEGVVFLRAMAGLPSCIRA